MQPLLSDKPLLVVPNPFCVPLDRRGRPCGAVQYDPEHAGGPPRYIGAERVDVLIERRPAYGAQQSKYDTFFRFDLTPVPIVDSQYHRDMVLGGALLPADEGTAKRFRDAAGKPVQFGEPSVTLSAARAAAIEAWRASHDGVAPDKWSEGEWPPKSPPKDGEKAPERPLLANGPAAKPATTTAKPARGEP